MGKEVAPVKVYAREDGLADSATEAATNPTITHHALSRAIERVPGIATVDQARALLSSPAIRLAARFGAHYVKLGSGHRVVVNDNTVITVLPSDAKAWRLKAFSPEFSK